MYEDHHNDGAKRAGLLAAFSALLLKWKNRRAIEQDKVVFYSFSQGYSCNPRAICDELLKRGGNRQLVWVAEKGKVRAPEGVRVVRGKAAMRRELSSARVIVSNSRLGNYWDNGYRKKPGQTYIQTWHGSYGIKKMEDDAPNLRPSYRRRAQLDSANIDILLSNCRWLTDRFKQSFFYTGEIRETGAARNDVLLHADSHPARERASRMRRVYGLRKGERVVLVAPTFRKRDSLPPLPDMRQLRAALATRFGGEWRVLLRLHPGFCTTRTPFDEFAAGEVTDVSSCQDVMDLLLVTDVMVSDYSSCIFDFLLTGRPGFLYAQDLDEYEKMRGLYYPLSESPFPGAESNEQLTQAICSFDETAYRERVTAFLRDKGVVDDGHASERVADIIEGILDGKEVRG